MVPLEETSQALLDVLRRAGDEWGPLGVALAAAQLSDVDAVVDAIRREQQQPIPDRLTKLALGPDDVILMRGDGWEPLEGEPPPETVICEWLVANDKHNLVARVGEDQDLLTLDEDAMRAAGWYRSPAYAINLPPDEDTRPLLVEGLETNDDRYIGRYAIRLPAVGEPLPLMRFGEQVGTIEGVRREDYGGPCAIVCVAVTDVDLTGMVLLGDLADTDIEFDQVTRVARIKAGRLAGATIADEMAWPWRRVETW